MSQEQNGKSAEEGTKTEVVVKAKRRQHPAEYKLRILREIDECEGFGRSGSTVATRRAVFIVGEQVARAA